MAIVGKRQASVLFHTSFYKKIERLAKKDGLTVAAWIRKLVIDKVRQDEVISEKQ